MNILWYGNLEGMYRGWWDMGIFEEFFKYEDHHEGLNKLPPGEGAIVILPGRALVGMEMDISDSLQRLPWMVLIVAGDEEGKFDVSKMKHPNMRLWVQYPYPELHNQERVIGCGFPPDLNQLKPGIPVKDLEWYFAGQLTHERRQLMYQNLKDSPIPGNFVGTPGFAQGESREDYYKNMSRAKIVPSPSGPETVDTFRTYEALELGAVPIVDTQTPKHDWAGFWEWLFKSIVPWPQIKDWSDINGYMEDTLKQYPKINNRCQAFWYRHKSALQKRLFKDAEDLGARKERSNVTIVVPVSPISSHPEIKIIEETLRTLHYHYPHSEMIVTFDGVRPEQEDKREAYEEHIRRVLWKFPNITPYIFEEHTHQSGMMRAIIDTISTPLILYAEHDTPLVIDEVIEWEKIENKILGGESNLVRLHFEAHIPKEHKHLMLDDKPHVGFVRTAQWSQRPHVASTVFYKRILSEYFSPKAKCFIEDLVHGKVINDFLQYGQMGWNQWRLHIYHPEGQIKRSYTTDGRAGGKKYDGDQVW